MRSLHSRTGRTGKLARIKIGSNTGMQTAHTTDQRLTELEIKASFTEDLLDQLDAVIVRQQKQIEALTREVQHLREQSARQGPDAPRNLRDELPPHF